LKALSDAAAKSVTDAKDQRTKELLWREWLYCELGAVPDALTGEDNGTSWWKYSQEQAVADLVSAPTSCTVPAVRNAADDADLRPEVKYFGSTDDLAAEEKPADGTAWSLWTATLVASTALAATSDEDAGVSGSMGIARNAHGKVAYLKGDKRAKDWVLQQRKAEFAFYDSVY